MTPPGTLIRIMKASPPWRWGYMPTHFNRSCSPGTLLIEAGPCLEYVSITAWATSNGMARQLQLFDGVQFADVAIGPDEFEAAVTPAPEFHAVGIVEVARH